jgi:4-hydroxy-3-methylbut-2-en-1-yl diphosphate synthase IspG/GcpE
MAPFLALPKKHMPRAQVKFVVQAGRKFRLFSLTLQRYKKIQSASKLFRKKSTQKSTHPEIVCPTATRYSATVKKTTIQYGEIP